ncbi:DUF4202 family protein [Polyangium aurulentum]|uniref:DUF4202 family protein n=1 Tax=Polyangium aurulentum TaxID=2567896 RepID=UPI0010AED6FB|nr:DUF4202 family protein [Polyangium aurulentum]UQA59412.1 DUF4202 domain-containing protein [Polyangium aurulentum]
MITKVLVTDEQGVEAGGDGPLVSISIAEWRRPEADLWAFDARVDAAGGAGPFALRIETDGAADCASAAEEILTRYQRFLRRTNEASSAALFARTLDAHRALYDLEKPLVKADYDHAIDAWQWVLRLDPRAGAAVQLAALFHDIERLVTEADVRVEHKAADYQAFKDAHAREGARMTRAALTALGWDEGTCARVGAIVEKHERPSGDPDLALLNDADALSFFSLNSLGFLNYYGLEHTARKVAFTLRRMRPSARERLRPVRYHPEVDRLLREAFAAGASSAETTHFGPTQPHEEGRA